MAQAHPTGDFKAKLETYKRRIDRDIEAYAKDMQTTTLKRYGAYARLEADTFLGILQRGGKRIRGALVCVGYEMCGGQDQAMILQAARAVEMMHAYILILDDIQDGSLVRRGGPTAHVSLSDYHRRQALAGDGERFGMSIAINSAILGAHAAHTVLSELDAGPRLRLEAIGIMNRTMIVTAHGQTGDIMNEVLSSVDNDSIERIWEWKTAVYSVQNPLHIGMALAGADAATREAVTPYALHAGKAFQITDDVLGTFGTEAESGKNPQDDIRQGKRTLLINHALENATEADKNFLLSVLGDPDMTRAQFERCKAILRHSGALSAARQRAAELAVAAQAALAVEAGRWSAGGVAFLNELVGYISDRKA